MNRSRPIVCTLFVVVALASAVFPASKVETTGACTSADVSDAVKAALQPQGFRVTGDAGVTCEIWLAKSLQQNPGSSGADYNTLVPGSFAGVIAYAAKSGDYRGQAVKPGVYTLRYLMMPADGNHMGVSPTQDYFMLAPAGSDQDPEKLFDYDTMVNLSRKASNTSHPAPLYLVPPAGGGSAAFRDAGDGRWAVEAKTKAKAKGASAEIDFPLALVLVGKGEG